MIPLRDDVPSRAIPIVNLSLIAVNTLFFLGEIGMGSRELQRFFNHAAVVPFAFASRSGTFSPMDAVFDTLDPSLASRVLLSMFLHGGWAHLIGNMLYLWIFGDNVEDRLGHLRYLFFYLLCGFIATYTHIFSDPGSKLPSIGASGAIAGVLGAYLALYPNSRVLTLLPLGIFFPVVQVPAVFFLGFWFLQQFISGAESLIAPIAQTGGTAWWAHVGGFAAGVLLVGIFQNPKLRPPPRSMSFDEWYSRRGPRALGI